MPGYSEEGDEVVLRMTRTDYNALLVVIGYAAGADSEGFVSKMATKLANAINRGNPRWTRYRIDGEEE